ncbi:MAG: hypothetical protein ACIAQF_11800 [Phycisphaerales bacterium JB065]
MTISTSEMIDQLSSGEIRLLRFLAKRPLDVWPALAIVKEFPFTPDHDLTLVVESLIERGLMLVQKTGVHELHLASSGLALTAEGVRVGFALARERLAQAPAGRLPMRS